MKRLRLFVGVALTVGALGGALGGTLGCAKEVAVAISLSVDSCTDSLTPTSPSALTGVGDFRFIVTSNGVTLPAIDVTEAQLSTALPQLPFDVPLRIDVYGLATPSSTTASSFGTTGNFTIPSGSSPSKVNLPIVIRAIDAFSGTPALGSAGGSCATLIAPRAYHAQTLLADGRVLIYGGLQFSSKGADWSRVLGMPPRFDPGTVYLSGSEIFDPSTGQFTDAGTFISSALDTDSRAFALLTSAISVDGGAALAGGEALSTASDGGTDLVGAVNGGLFFPKQGGEWGPFRVGAHGHGCLASDVDGHAMIASGLNGSGVVAASGDTLDMTTWIPNDSLLTPNNKLTEARADQACSGLEGILGATFGGLVAEIGGFTTDSSGKNARVLGDLYLYKYADAGFTQLLGANGAPYDEQLLAGPRTRAKAAALTVVDGTTSKPTDAILITGGLTCDLSDGGQLCAPSFAGDGGTAGQLAGPIANYFPHAVAQTELLGFPISVSGGGAETANPSLYGGSGLPALSTPRVDHCEVSLGDGRILILGGLGPLSDGGFGTLSDAVVTAPGTSLNEAGTVVPPKLVEVQNPLRQARAGMACTLMRDGAVLVTGGYQTTAALSGSTQAVKMLNAVEVYRPSPASVPQ